MLEIYFSDLNDEAKQRVLDYFGVENSEEANLDIDLVPLVIIEISDDKSEM